MTAVGILLIGGGLVLVYAGLTGDNPVAQLQRVLAPKTSTRAPRGTGAPATVTAPVPSGPRAGKPVPVS